MALALAILLLGATRAAAAPVGFVDLPRLLASHPLHAVLARYDREIAALQGTQTIIGLRDAAAQTQRSADAVGRAAAAAQSRVAQIGASSDTYQRLEGNALAARSASDREMATYRDELIRETSANITAYVRGVAQRTQRAYDAREQQLREKELTLAFDLARRNAGERLALTLKLDDLHLDKASRARYRSQLAALQAAQARALAVMHRADAATLGSYRVELERDAITADAQMAAELRSKALANLSLRQRISQGGPSQASAFRASYRFKTDAAALSAGLGNAGNDISQRFSQLANSDRRSQSETAAQIATLQADRRALYRAIVGQIVRDAQRLARMRHLATVDASNSRPPGSVDLTAAVSADLNR
jgi:hypothetical protein